MNCVYSLLQLLLLLFIIIIILPVEFYGFETWSIFREKHMLRVFENKVLRKIFGAERDKITGE